jgi:hypothetical protein
MGLFIGKRVVGEICKLCVVCVTVFVCVSYSLFFFFFCFSNVSLDGNALLFRLGQAKDIKENVYQLNLNAGESTAAATEALNFKERACVIIKNIMNDAIMTN